MKCENCNQKTNSPTGLCYDCWFKLGSPSHKKRGEKING